jgi:Fe-S-cluster containining protein
LKDQIEQENIKEIERQLERLGFFSQNGLTNLTKRVNELEAALSGLISTLILGANIDEVKLREVTALVRKSMAENGEQHQLAIYMNSPDAPEEVADALPMVNCEERLHVCKAVCCKFKFALEPAEIEGGIVKWDLGIPYQIRQRKDGYCTHMNNEKSCCSIYYDRPNVCRKFNCAYDERIWKDYEKMELNHVWIAENIQEQKFTFPRK